MRYTFTFAAFAALASMSLAAPVLDKRGLVILTETTTIITTETVLGTNYIKPEPTPDAQANAVENNTKIRSFTRHSSPAPTPVQPPVTSAPAVEEPEPTPPPVVPSPEPVPTTYISIEPIPTPEPAPPAPEPETTPAPVPTTAAPAPTPQPTPPPPPPPPAPPAPATPAAPAGNSFESQCLDAHNSKRAIHGAPALKWDATMASHANSVSAKCVFQHSGSKFGENLAAGYSSPAAAIQAWYNENTSYNYGAGQFSGATGHFTQMVWKSAKAVGCGIAVCNGANGTPGSFLTCNYDTGNVIGQFLLNVLPPGSK